VARVVAAIGIGSSLGDRHAHIAFAKEGLAQLLSRIRFSSVIETEPVDVPGEQTPFLNAAVVGESDMDARRLLAGLHALEAARGRGRPYPNAHRTLDLDLILFGDLVVSEPGLSVPHPRFRTRAFVLEPLAEIGGWLIDPVSGLTVDQLAQRLKR
jgi:2-amino-4-hydroxy-6-hydroxymethyldihydropteridine diphosphokinase